MVPLWLYLFWGLRKQYSMILYVFFMCLSCPLCNVFGCILECCHMVESWPSIILMCAFYCHYDVTSPLFLTSGFTLGCGSGVFSFIFPNIIIGYFPIFGVTVKSWLLIDWKKIIVFLLGSLVGFNIGMPLQQSPQRFLIGEWIWLRCTFHLGSFLVNFLEFLLAYLPE